MIKNIELENYRIKSWEPDTKTQNWIWNQLMGETEKGDTMEFVMIGKGRDVQENLCAGVLKSACGRIKGLIPAEYNRFYNGVMDSVDFEGTTRHDEMDTLGTEMIVGHSDASINEIAEQFFRTGISEAEFTSLLEKLMAEGAPKQEAHVRAILTYGLEKENITEEEANLVLECFQSFLSSHPDHPFLSPRERYRFGKTMPEDEKEMWNSNQPVLDKAQGYKYP